MVMDCYRFMERTDGRKLFYGSMIVQANIEGVVVGRGDTYNVHKDNKIKDSSKKEITRQVDTQLNITRFFLGRNKL